jgi:hypothetical protein
MSGRLSVTVMSRERAQGERPACAACISITDRHRSDAALVGWQEVLRLKFDDIECEGSHYLPLSNAQADDILAFARRHQDIDLVAHCEFGYSRSVAVGVFLSAWLDRPLSADLSHPNSLVIAKLCIRGLRKALRWRDARLAVVCLVGPMSFALRRLVPRETPNTTPTHKAP